MDQEQANVIGTLTDALSKAYNANQKDLTAALANKITELVVGTKVTGDQEFAFGETAQGKSYASTVSIGEVGVDNGRPVNEQEAYVAELDGRCPCCILREFVQTGEWNSVYTLQDFLYQYARVEGFDGFRGLILHVIQTLQEDMGELNDIELTRQVKRMSDISNAGVEAHRVLATEGRAPALNPLIDTIINMIKKKVGDL